MTSREALVALNIIENRFSLNLSKVVELFVNPQDIFLAKEKHLESCGLQRSIINKIKSLEIKEIEDEFSLAENLGLKVITIEENEYPLYLKYISCPPRVIYVLGKIDAFNGLNMAIVGSRRASFYGLSAARKFAQELSGKGFLIVSGLAKGIDTFAHRGALSCSGKTIAVMGSGFKHIYPKENKDLAFAIAKEGAVISEFPFNTPPLKHNFPKRNRIISGLSLGVLVVEAARNSGALITANFALEQAREVFALPGEINSKNSYGTNSLIKQGAKLVLSIEDIIEELSYLGQSISIDDRKNPYQEGLMTSQYLNKEECRVYSLLSADKALSFDELISSTDLGVGFISDILLKLELQDLVTRMPGNYFLRRVNEKKELGYS